MQKNYTRYHYDFDKLPWLTSPKRQLELQGIAPGIINLQPNKGYTFTHKHREHKGLYVDI